MSGSIFSILTRIITDFTRDVATLSTGIKRLTIKISGGIKIASTLGPFLEDLKRLANVWRHEHPARALGGIRSMAGFNCQLTFALLKTVRSWLQQSGLDQSTPKVFTEILSDILDATSADVAEIVQVKRTMGSGAVHKALDEFSEIYRLAERHTPQSTPPAAVHNSLFPKQPGQYRRFHRQLVSKQE